MARERKRLGRYLNNSSIVHKLILIKNNVRGMAQLVARLSGGQEAVSSSLATPTKIKRLVFASLFIFVAVSGLT